MQHTKEDLPEISFKIPGKLKQFGVFIKRDILKKLNDIQYLVDIGGTLPQRFDDGAVLVGKDLVPPAHFLHPLQGGPVTGIRVTLTPKK